MKDLPYITHDFGARNDPKLMDLQMDLGGQGLGIFWCLVEMLWENGGAIPANYRSIAFALRWCKPEEVEKVVTGYGLFEVRDGQIESHSASTRISQMRTRFNARSEAGRAAGLASARSRSRTPVEQPQDDRSTDVEQSLNGRSTNAELLTNLLTNKQTKDNINNTPLTAANFYEILFFENIHDPAGELKRFIDYYEDRKWTYRDGSPVTDYEQAAKDWKPLKAGKRFDTEALRWYKAVWGAASRRVDNALDIFLVSLANIRRKDQKVDLVYATADAARAVAAFIQDNDLAGDWQLDFRVQN